MTQIGKPQSAIPYLKKALLIDSTHRFVITSISAAYRQIGDYDNWFEYFKKIIWYDDKVVASLDSVLQEQGYRAAVEMTIKIEEEVANERYIDIFLVGYRYLQIDNYEKAMDCYEKGYEIHHPNMPYISVNQYGYEQLKENPRYIELLKKMNLPLPGD
jgi:tetratricopeptide (TPR) repeat protein